MYLECASKVELALKSLKDWDAKVGDTFVYHLGGSEEPTGRLMTIMGVNEGKYYSEDLNYLSGDKHWSLVSRAKEITTEQEVVKDPSRIGSYYNFPFKDWTTVNDMIDHMSQKQWGWRSYIFKDIIKACFRFGQKEGTTEVYDAEKIIYYGVRLLMSVSDKTTARKYLQQLLDDKQFKENG